jgi:hypothetical protein
MKKSLLFLIPAALLFACGQNSTDATQTEEKPVGASFGEAFTPENVMTIEDLAAKLAVNDTVFAQFRATIIQTCSKMGCWMDVELPDGSEMTVFMRDHAFFVPVEGMEGKTAIINGFGYRTEHTVDFLRHLAEDAGMSAEEAEATITEPKLAFAFDAGGVIIEGIEQPADDHAHHDHDHDHEH